MVTAGYAPLEQYHSVENQGPWSDLYGLGATMLHCVSGYAPPSATERIAAIHDGMTDPVDDVFELVQRNYSKELNDLIKWMIQTQSKERPQSTGEVLRFLGIEGTDTPSIELIESSRDAAVTLSENDIDAVTMHLTHHIGPMAKVLVRKAGKQVSDVDVLTQLLARFIPDEDAKTEFLGQTQLLREENSRQLSNEELPAAAEKAANTNGVLAPELIKNAEQHLSVYLGPMAKIVVRKAVRKSASVDEFLNELALEIPAEKKKKFLDLFL